MSPTNLPAAPAGEELSSWRAGPARQAIERFVAQACGEGRSAPVPIDQRVAVFDNDGTLWCEKPMPIQLDFILRRLVEMAAADRALRARQPWKAAYTRDYQWFDTVMTQHYAGDDRNVKTLMAGVLAAHAGVSVEAFEGMAESFLRATPHPTLGRGYLQTGYAPMIELLGYLTAHGFTNYIASGGGRDFMRPITHEIYGVPRERVIGSTTTLAYTSDAHGGTITHTPVPDYLDDGTQKPIRIWSRIGRRPMLAAGNSNGDGPMLDYTRHTDKPYLRLLIVHDDSDREFEYATGADQALEQADRDDWTVVSMKNDWSKMF